MQALILIKELMIKTQPNNKFCILVCTKYLSIINLTNFTQDFFSFSRRINRRIASYETIYATPKMRKKTSKNVKLIMIRNVHGISSSTGAGFLFVFKAWQQAHSKLRNCCHNAEDGQKNKLVAEVISCTFLRYL